MKKKQAKAFITTVKIQAIEEYTEIVRAIRMLENKNSGLTGFLETLKESAKRDLVEFLGI